MIRIKERSMILCLLIMISCFLDFTCANKKLTKKTPIIQSYYWPVTHGDKNFYSLNMTTPNVIDIRKDESNGSKAVRTYWEKEGKILLNLVYPFRYNNTEEALYKEFVENIQDAKGISIDEIVGFNLPKNKKLILINLLKRSRTNFPDKIISVWGSAIWDDTNVDLLKTINDYADIFVIEIYISEKLARGKGFNPFKGHVKQLEKLVPGILKKTIIGIGLYPDMNNDPGVDFETHVLSQVRYLRTDPFLKKLPGIALFAPHYLPTKTQKSLDELLKSFFISNKP